MSAVARDTRPRLLVVHHTLQPPGGGSAVAAWAIEALRDDYALDVLTFRPVRVAAVNRAFGTSLRDTDARWLGVPGAARALCDAVPLPLALLTSHLLFREASMLAAAGGYAAVLSTINEVDVGVPALQYVHYPWRTFPRPKVDYRWYHLAPLLALYRRLSMKLSAFDPDAVRRNRTLTNSDWTGRVYRRSYGAPATTLYPPVPGGFPERAFDARAPAFAVLGRISPQKRVLEIIDIVRAVRARGHDVALRVIGHVDDRAYAARVRRHAAPHRDWVSFHVDLDRTALVALVADCRYAIHGMHEEHFGIAPAELQRAGCITFVPAGGGPPEIVGHDERVLFDSDAEAVERIHRVLTDAAYRERLWRDVQARRDAFTEQRFMDGLRGEVADFVATRAH